MGLHFRYRPTQKSMVNYNYDIANRLVLIQNQQSQIENQYDANGNTSTSSVQRLFSDGLHTYSYDSASEAPLWGNRLKSILGAGTSVLYRYNGLDDRLQETRRVEPVETVNGADTNFTIDLNTGLTQALSDGRYTYLYGNGRIAQESHSAPGTSHTDYFLGDALGSVRQLTDAIGAVTLSKMYEPYGTVSMTSGAGQTDYGYTDEYQSGNSVYLRSRFYMPSTGRFLTRDTWSGDANRPLSLNRWNYTNANPINFTDPSGHLPIKCQSMTTKAEYEKCVLDFYDLQPIDETAMGATVIGTAGCYEGPTKYRAKGYLEGIGWQYLYNKLGITYVQYESIEVVYDFATMQLANFRLTGVGESYPIPPVFADSGYAGFIGGFKHSDENTVATDYGGLSFFGGLGVNNMAPISTGLGMIGWSSINDPKVNGINIYLGAGIPLRTPAGWFDIPVDVPLGITNATLYGRVQNYIMPNDRVNTGEFTRDIAIGLFSPFRGVGIVLPSRVWAYSEAMHYAWVYEKLHEKQWLGFYTLE